MANVPFNNLGQYGLHTDRKPHELMVEAWSRADNILFNSEGVHAFPGHVQAAGTPLFAPRWLFPWQGSGFFRWLYAGAAKIAQIDGVTHTDLTRYTTVPGDDDYTTIDTTRFSGAQLGDLPVLTYSGQVDPPQAYNTSNSRFEDLPNWPANAFCDIICEQDRHLVAMKVKKDGVSFNPRQIKWSQAADPATYPNSWDETDPATGAGERTLPQGGNITATEVLGDIRLIYKESAVYYMRFIGGQSIWETDVLFSQFGCIGPYAVKQLEKSHIVVTAGDVILHNGLTWKSVIDDKNRKLLFDNLNAAYKDETTVVVKFLTSQVWICYADNTSTGQLNKALVWDYVDNTWSFRDLQNFDHLALGAIDTSGVSRVYDVAPQTTTTYDQANEIYDVGSTPIVDDILIADFANTLLYKANVGNQFDAVPVPRRLERTGLAVVGRDRQGNWKIDLDSRKFIRRIHFNMEATGPVYIYVGNQESPNGAITWSGPFTFDPRVDNFIDPFLNCKFFGLRIESATDIGWSLYSYTLEIEVLGEGAVYG